MNLTSHEVTGILQEWREGNSAASQRLFPLVYDELKRQARQHLRRERADHTLQPTALVHEAYLRMIDQTSPALENRAHFFAFAARVMRQILVDHAREHKAEKRGGSAQRLSLADIDLLPQQSATDMLELNEAMQKLEAIDERKCRVVDMRFFGGLKEAEIAEVLGVTEKTVRRDWQFAKLWLYRELSGNPA
ncbi:MAG TPA: sigma-70 family RNA polymerase sigma factor [Pyrinomonadaceae bacterium]|jgi:RNA polymerase sigma factor (TIGR02999 family)|nr:sigma-70 family RNA polymerase sigma factor [Pyrinomonadaceae bacterium]